MHNWCKTGMYRNIIQRPWIAVCFHSLESFVRQQCTGNLSSCDTSESEIVTCYFLYWLNIAPLSCRYRLHVHTRYSYIRLFQSHSLKTIQFIINFPHMLTVLFTVLRLGLVSVYYIFLHLHSIKMWKSETHRNL